jgi:hypothetical protein
MGPCRGNVIVRNAFRAILRNPVKLTSRFFTDWRLVLRQESDSIEAIIHTEGATHVFTEFFVRGTVV